jgi:hypothetical protein
MQFVNHTPSTFTNVKTFFLFHTHFPAALGVFTKCGDWDDRGEHQARQKLAQKMDFRRTG